MAEQEQHTVSDDEQNPDFETNQKDTPVNNQDKFFGIIGFMLVGNLMIKLIENGVINMHDAYDIIRNTQASYKNRKTFEELEFEADEYVDLLLNKLWASRQDIVNAGNLSSEHTDTDAVE